MLSLRLLHVAMVSPAPTAVPGFKWSSQWYPVLPVSYAVKDAPNALSILGRKMVIWRSSESGWSCIEDACPHRLVPLSTGKVSEEGALVCRFHGWQFGADGNCISIPNANEATAARLCGAASTCATSFPVREEGGLLWVWPERGPAAAAESRESVLATLPGAIV